MSVEAKDARAEFVRAALAAVRAFDDYEPSSLLAKAAPEVSVALDDLRSALAAWRLYENQTDIEAGGRG